MGPTFVRFQNFGRQTPNSPWWMVMAPGLMLISFGVAILVWPELLAYLVAFIILSLGITVTGWGWRLRQVERQQMRSPNSQRNVRQQRQQNRGTVGAVNQDLQASETTIYYEQR